MYSPRQMKNFLDEIIHASDSDTVPKKLTMTILTQGKTVRVYDPGNLKCLLIVDDRLLMDHLMTHFLFVDKLEEILGELDYFFQCFGNFFACFFLIKFLIDVVAFVLRRLEFR